MISGYQIADFEAHLTQYIVYVDTDAFTASVELLRNRSLTGKPFAVCSCQFKFLSAPAEHLRVSRGHDDAPDAVLWCKEVRCLVWDARFMWFVPLLLFASGKVSSEVYC